MSPSRNERKISPEGPSRTPLPAWPGPRGFLLAPVVLVLAACGDAIPEGLAEGDAALEVTATELFQVGALEGDDWETFARVTQVAFDAAGNLYILDPDRHRVVVVDPDGEYLRSVGSRGEGPGELRVPLFLGVEGDGTVVVGDSGARSYVIYGPDGAYLRTVPVTDDDGRPTSSALMHPDHGIVNWGRSFTFSGGDIPEIPPEVPVRLTALDGTGTRVLGEAWTPPREFNLPGIRIGGGSQVQISFAGGPSSRAFEPAVRAAVFPDGRVAVADSSDYRIRVFRSEGGEAGSFTRDIRPHPIGEREQQMERDRRLTALESGETRPPTMVMMGGPGGGGGSFSTPDNEEWRERQRQQIAELEFWHEIPVVRSLAADPAGRLWVERAALPGDEGPVDLLGATGSYLGSIPPGGVRPPAAFGPDGRAAYIELDEFDVPRVRVVRLNGLP